ncbi:hydrogenase 4 subunit D [Thermococcus gammatolerans]|uniref:Formate hydrogenlyase I subunit C (Mhy1C) n=1 Tax=Thermococcus gammatolerans (strain DSM 15229 / JCM 11827 / EJ3) TaxID=593117 RepID=C5A3D7_THEGJ|nr:hydrogenase 4 subunit D [Thermococcus gammatolerans]ACS32749.1 formate hydrogenlyase I subunit C (Mhy1C) [Thermococcus gammatolerans EJ3]
MNGTVFIVSALLPFLLLLIYRTEGRTADGLAILITGLTLAINGFGAYAFFGSGADKVYHFSYASGNKLGEVFGLNVDVASVLMGFVSILTAFLLVLYAADYLGPSNRGFPLNEGKGRFYALLGLLVGSSMAFIYSTNLVQFAIFLELMAVALFYLVNFHGNAEGKALKAFLVLNLGVFLLLLSIVLLGNGQELANMGSLSQSTKDKVFAILTFAAFAMSSQFFFYSWLPDATAGPVPASAYIHAASVVPLGSFMLFRVIQYMNPGRGDFWLLGALTVALILLMMIYYPLQRDAKRLIAYSTIGQTGVSYITLAYALLGHDVGLQIAIYQVVNHAFVKALAFMSVGAFVYSLGTTDLKGIRGIKRSLPWASVAWFLSFLGLAGVLPLGLFFSKAFTIMSTREIGGIASWLFPAVVLFDAAIFLVVVLLWFREIFFGEPEPRAETGEPKLMIAAMVVLILIGIVAPWITLDVVMKISFMG